MDNCIAIRHNPHGEERALARVSNHEEFAAILRDAAKTPLLRMRSIHSAVTLMVRSAHLARVSNHEELAAILRDAAQDARLLRMRATHGAPAEV
jgi:hypothetical protein